MEPYYQDDLTTLYCGDARDVLPKLWDRFDLVLTDPPYPKKYQYLYETLGSASSHLLNPGGSLVTLCGHYQVPDVLDILRNHLRFWWIGGMLHRSLVRMPGKWVTIKYKPALWFVKDRRRPGDHECPVDLFANGKDKRYHEWGQDIPWFAHWIKMLTTSEMAVLDPFAGGGTTLIAARMLDRRSIGIEIDEAHCKTVVERIQHLDDAVVQDYLPSFVDHLTSLPLKPEVSVP